MAGRTWSELLRHLIAGGDLDTGDTQWAMDQVMTGEAGDVRLAAFLTALAAKGPTVAEIRGLADSMQEHALRLPVSTDAVDIVGTGGDGARTVNISTMASLVIAGTGIPVAKHGNRAATSACGAADVIEELGVRLDSPVNRVAQIFNHLNITFCFANMFHPSMRFAAGVRRELGFPTAFNILGPLTNPARPRACAVGVADERMAPLVAGVFASRGRSALVFRGKDCGLDELSTVGINQIWHVEDGKVEYLELDPVTEFGLTRCEVADLAGGDAPYNAEVVREVLAGRTGPVRDTVLLNAAAGIVAHGSLPGTAAGDGDLRERLNAGLGHAQKAVDSGAAAKLLGDWVRVSRA